MRFKASILRVLMFVGVLFLASIPSALAGFSSSESFLPAVGRVSGNGGAQFFTTVWATNLTGAAVTFTFDFLQQGQANLSPASFDDSLAPGQTKVYENVVESKLGLSNALGAARVVSSGAILLGERIYNQEPGDDLGKTEGLFFAGVPKSFSISLGQSASIQGVNQGGSENFRYDFALVETGGGSPTVHVTLLDGNGVQLGARDYVLQPYEQIQPNVAEIFSGVATTNSRISATVTGGTGSALLAGAQVANESQDGTGFEMSFPDLLNDVVTSLNGLTGALTLEAGNNIAIAQDGASALKISATVTQGPVGPAGPRGPQGPPGPVNAVSTDTPNTAALRDGTGSFAMGTLSLDGNLRLPTTSATAGVVYVNGASFIHSFGTSNTFIGIGAGNFTMTGGNNTASGYGAFFSNTTGIQNTATGLSALESNTTGSDNTATGVHALIDNTTGSDNTATGFLTLALNTTGSDNTASGFQTLLNNTSGSKNTAVGFNALAGKTTGDNNIAIGSGAGANITNDDDNIDIGNAGVADEGLTIRIGDAQRAAFIAGIRGKTTGNNDAVDVVIDSSGQLGTVSSSRRYKEDIRDMGDASRRLLDLRPVTFRYKKPFADGQKPIQYGLIAEEVAQAFPELVAYGSDKKPETVKYQTLSVLLLNELQVQHGQVARLTDTLTRLNKHNEDLQAQLAAQEQTNAARLASLERRLAAIQRVVFVQEASNR
ncbi:MAG: tail fiber domain-containing protein [Thermoanaerobaculia bacterium]